MITTSSSDIPFQVGVTNGRYSTVADTSEEKGGGGRGFRAHELLEAAVASCLNITLQRLAKKYNIPIGKVTTRVSVNNNFPAEAVIQYAIDIEGTLSDGERKKLIKAARNCPVHQILLKEIRFRRIDFDKGPYSP